MGAKLVEILKEKFNWIDCFYTNVLLLMSLQYTVMLLHSSRYVATVTIVPTIYLTTYLYFPLVKLNFIEKAYLSKPIKAILLKQVYKQASQRQHFNPLKQASSRQPFKTYNN